MAIPSTQCLGDDAKLQVPQTQLLQDSASERSSSPTPEKFQPGWRFIAAFLSLCIITLMAALDATSLSVALPVSSLSNTSRMIAKDSVDHG
jgi:hypothetical protein